MFADRESLNAITPSLNETSFPGPGKLADFSKTEQEMTRTCRGGEGGR